MGGPYKVAYNTLMLDKIDWTRIDNYMMKSFVYLLCVVWFKHATAGVQTKPTVETALCASNGTRIDLP